MESSYDIFSGELDQNQQVDYMNGNTNFLKLDEFLEFPKETEEEIMAEAFFNGINIADSSSFTVVDSSNSSSVSGGHLQFNGNVSCRSFTDIHFSGNELCVPYDDLADIEWLSNLVEESFSSDDLQDLKLINPPTENGKSISASTATTSSSAATNLNNTSSIFHSEVSVPGKARSKRSRAAPCDWSSRLVLLSRPNSSGRISHISPKPTPGRKRESMENPGRRCLHCASEKTPQWRTGPMGPKTLCNACGVRYKSGRLVPEYRPASSPTFVSAKHSNSHRKVLELQRQRDLRMQQQQLLSHASIFGISDCGDDFFHHPRPHPRQMQNFCPADYRFIT